MRRCALSLASPRRLAADRAGRLRCSRRPRLDPSGHWSGAIHVPPFNGACAREIGVEIDLAKNARGVLDGTVQPARAKREGAAARRTSRVDGTPCRSSSRRHGGGLFHGTLADAGIDLRRIRHRRGRLQHSLRPEAHRRRADRRRRRRARRSARSWKAPGTARSTWAARPERLVLKMTNHADGTVTGTILDLDGSNVEIPIAHHAEGVERDDRRRGRRRHLRGRPERGRRAGRAPGRRVRSRCPLTFKRGAK